MGSGPLGQGSQLSCPIGRPTGVPGGISGRNEEIGGEFRERHWNGDGEKEGGNKKRVTLICKVKK